MDREKKLKKLIKQAQSKIKQIEKLGYIVAVSHNELAVYKDWGKPLEKDEEITDRIVGYISI